MVKPGTVEIGTFSGLDWFPTLTAAAGNPDITDQLLKGVKLGDRTYKNLSLLKTISARSDGEVRLAQH